MRQRSCFHTHPVVLCPREGWASLHVGFEELVREVLGEEGEHEAGFLRVGDELSPQQKLLHDHLDVRQLLLTCKESNFSISKRSDRFQKAH